jgi:hypothetical protein
MAELMLAGISHYPPLRQPDEQMANLLKYALADPGIPAAQKDVTSWPADMRAEWEEFPTSAAKHREQLVANFLRVREAIDEFQPDIIVMWGDDQYENFRENIIPPFCVLGYEETRTQPWKNVRHSGRVLPYLENVWGEPADQEYVVRGSREIGKALATGLLERGIDMAYAYEPLNYPGLSHAFLNAVMFLDYGRKGFPYPVLPIAVNCYGSRLIRTHGGPIHYGTSLSPEELDPPSPSPARCFALGAATAAVLAESPWRAMIVASSSWSHAFLTDHTYRLRPDRERDRFFYDALVARDYAAFRDVSLNEIEYAGLQELLNWSALAGALDATNADCQFSDLVETWIFNSSKCFGLWR